MENDARDFTTVKEIIDRILKYTYLVSCRFLLLTRRRIAVLIKKITCIMHTGYQKNYKTKISLPR
jgi:hypothetical protein